MCDDLTDWIVRQTKSRTPFVVKCVYFASLFGLRVADWCVGVSHRYVPYGALAEVRLFKLFMLPDLLNGIRVISFRLCRT